MDEAQDPIGAAGAPDPQATPELEATPDLPAAPDLEAAQDSDAAQALPGAENSPGAQDVPGAQDLPTEEDLPVDTDKIDDTVLALLFLSLGPNGRAWKGLDWDTLSRLHAKGYIGNPVGKAKSVVMTEDGIARSERLFRELFVTAD